MKLQVAGINFSYNHTPVLDEVNFNLERGKIMGVLGVNGAGKSTLLKCLNRILKPSVGSVLIDGNEVNKMPRNQIARHFGYVPQKTSEGNLTVFDTVLLGRKPYMKWSASHNDFLIVGDILSRLHCDHLAMRPTSQLSGGEYQKVIIARALAQQPQVLLLDEPTSSLDLKNQLQVMNIVKTAVQDYGISAIISLHDINLALRFADHFLMLKKGSIHFLSPTEHINDLAIEEVYGVKVSITNIEGYQIVVPRDGE